MTTRMTQTMGSWLVALVLLFATADLWARELPDFTGLVEQYSPAVVNISTRQDARKSSRIPHFRMPDLPENSPFNDLFKHFFGEQGELPENHPPARSLGSGFVISDDGYILTNHHVVDGADEIIVRMSDRREFIAEVIGTDPRSDIALIKIDADHVPYVRPGKADALKVGEWVLAIGSPFGFDHSVTAGIVSAKGRSLPSENYVPFIQTDVAINPGNSGGPLFNLDGEVVGINSQIYSRTGGFMGLSFAIPIDVAMDVADQLKESGRVSRGWLGVLIQDVTRELAESFGMERPHGALIAKVLAGSPAEKAGLEVGDVILKFRDAELGDSSSLPPMVGRSRVGRAAELEILRNGKRITREVVIGELPTDEALETAARTGPATSNRLGVAVSELSPQEREELRVGSEQGVKVEQIQPGPAQEAGIRPGDVILSINNKAVNGVDGFRELVDGLEPGRSVAFLIQRDSGPLFLALRLPEE